MHQIENDRPASGGCGQNDGLSNGLGNELKNLHEEKLHSVSSRIDRLRDAAGTQLTDETSSDIAAAMDNLSRIEIRVGLIGPTSAGKSTLLSATSAVNLDDDLLPTGGSATSALSTTLSYGEQKHFLIKRKSGLTESMTHDEFHAVRLETDQGEGLLQRPKNANHDDPAEGLYCQGVLPKDFQGIELIDSRGAFDGGEGTNSALKAAKTWDVVVVVERDQAGGVGRDSMLEIVKQASNGKALFVIINQKYPTPPDVRYKSDIFRTYIKGLGREQGVNWSPDINLADHNIFFINALSALEARKNDDAAGARASGLVVFEQSLAAYMIDNAWKTRTKPWLMELRGISNSLHLSLERETARVIASEASMAVTHEHDIEENRERLEILRETRDEVSGLADEILPSLKRDFQNQIVSSGTAVGQALDDASLEAATGMKILKLIRKKNREGLTDEINEIIMTSLESQIDEWTTKPEGIEKVLDPAIKGALDKVVRVLAESSILLEKTTVNKFNKKKKAVASELSDYQDEWEEEIISSFAPHVKDMNKDLAVTSDVAKGAVVTGVGATAITLVLTHALTSTVGLKIKTAIATALLHVTVLKTLMLKLSAAIAGLVISGPVGLAVIGAATVLGAKHAAKGLEAKMRKAARQGFDEHAKSVADGLWKEVSPEIKKAIDPIGDILTDHLDRNILAIEERGLRLENNLSSESIEIKKQIVSNQRRARIMLAITDEFDLDLAELG